MTLLTTGAIFVTLMLVETVYPREGSQPSRASRIKSAFIWATFLPLSAVAVMPLAGPVAALGIHPLLPSLAPPHLPAWLATAMAALLAAFVGDFFYYWMHRLQHQVPFLWRFHATHHSVREMSAVTGYHHFTDALPGLLLYSLPLSFLTTDPHAMMYIGSLITIQGHYLHSVTRLHFGPLRYVVADNRFHRIHHSRDPAHFNRNYGVFTSVWDQLFGTAYFPKPDEWPDAGLDDQREPESVSDYLLQPFRRRKLATAAA